jgi:hypothetical protein
VIELLLFELFAAMAIKQVIIKPKLVALIMVQ